MFNSPFFETILSLVFIILIFSVLVSCVQEGIVSIFKHRGKMLQFAIKEMLDDRLNKNFAYLLYQHPQIDLLKKKQNDLPSYISAESFASALIDLIASESVETIYVKKDDGLQKKGDTTEQAGNAFEKKEVLKKDLFKNTPALTQLAGKMKVTSADVLDVVDPSVVPITEKFNAGIESLKQSDLKKLLQSFTQPNAGNSSTGDIVGNIEDLKKNIEKWYTLYMERVTGWYKRKIRKNIFFASTVVTLVFNLNFITLSKTIYADSNLRGPLANMAIAVGNDTTSSSTYIQTIKKKIGTDSSLGNINMNAVIGVELPIGWKPSPCAASATGNWFERTAKQIGCFFRNEVNFPSILGWLLFILALSLGAPFWFDLLKKIVNIRNSGASPLERKTK